MNKRRIVHNSKEFLEAVKKSKPHKTIIYDERGCYSFPKRNFLSPNRVKIPIEFIIELGLIRKRNVCAKCGKKMDIKDYHIQLCRDCRLIEFDRISEETIKQVKERGRI